jgi:hypothetical protein
MGNKYLRACQCLSPHEHKRAQILTAHTNAGEEKHRSDPWESAFSGAAATGPGAGQLANFIATRIVAELPLSRRHNVYGGID